IYLKIEPILNYSPVLPDMMAGPPIHYARDCMRNMGHEDGTIPSSEVNVRTLTALVYREYLDPTYLIPKPDKLVLADVNEPKYHRRVPGTVIYTHPGERLKIHVLNADMSPHSLHAHGLVYGIDSDGSWAWGTQSHDGRRSDEICPGQTWTYTFYVTDKNIGAWPFHDHCHDIGANVNRGLFGGIIVLPPEEKHAPPKFHLPPEVEELLRELLKLKPQIGPIPMDHETEEDPDHEAEVAVSETKRQREEHGGAQGRFDLLHLGPISFEEYLHLPDVHPKPKPADKIQVP